MAASAFMYLFMLGTRPLHFMALNGANHAFVLIGRTGGQDNDPRSWSHKAVVCDPWAYGMSRGLVATQGGPNTFGYAFTAYGAWLLDQNMKAMHPKYAGARTVHDEPR